MRGVQRFELRIPEKALEQLHARLQSTRWIDDVFDGDWQFGAPLPFVQALCNHWLYTFDWRAFEARINRQPNITTQIEGLTIHAIDRRSTRSDALPLLMLHGWPGSFVEFLDLLDPLSQPAAGIPAFHVVTPSLPGYGFSTTKPGMTPQRIAATVVALMDRLGYDRFMVQGGDWGSLIGTEIARQYPERVIGLHLNLVNGSAPSDADNIPLTELEQSWVAEHGRWATYGHFILNSQSPASMAHALNDSPAGLAAWIGEKFIRWADNRDTSEPAVSLDRMIGNIALYWFTGTAGSSARLYYEMIRDLPQERFVTVPTAGAIFPKEVVKLPRRWAEHHYNIVQWTPFERGGHFPAMEVPDLLIDDMRRFATTVGSLP